MNLTREELLKQKAIIEGHLAWLNQKLAQLPGTSDTLTTQEAATSKTNMSADESVLQPSSKTELQNPAHAAEVDVDQFVATPSSSGVTGLQKVGCIIAAVSICLLFLGVLFGEYVWSLLFPDI